MDPSAGDTRSAGITKESELKILAGEHWKEGYLDYACGADAVRILPVQWLNVAEVRSQYFQPARSWRLVWNYIREIGLAATLRKIRSRSAEAASRNTKMVSVGIGVVVETGAGITAPAKGVMTGFIATNHPECVERVVVPTELLFPIDACEAAAGHISYLAADACDTSAAERLGTLGSWSELSGNPLPADMKQLFSIAAAALAQADWTVARQLPADDQPASRQTATSPAPSKGRKSAVLYGYGNYAKTIALPNVSNYMSVQAVHEIDPAQLPRPLSNDMTWDTRYWAESSDQYDVYLIAGYHHTHAEIAEHALAQGAAAVVEKPIVTSAGQLESLKTALENAGGGLYSGFHKRFARYNEWIYKDLRAELGSPINMHSIVFEMPLPDLHWYRWKNSCSRIVSNGSHWIDHFLFINDYSPVAETDVFIARDETVNVSVALENDAILTMVLSDYGSRRLGVQNNVEFRNSNGTVRVINDGNYFAESHDRVLRRANLNRLETYNRMYQTIAKRIAEGDTGDTVESFVASAGLILEVERLALQRLAGEGEKIISNS